MYRYDKEKNILRISKFPEVKRSAVYQDNVQYVSYMDYVNRQLLSDIETYVLKPISMLGYKADHWIEYDNSRTRVMYDNTDSYTGSEYFIARASLKTKDNPSKGAEPFVLFKIPVMDEYGVIHKDNKDYAIISKLCQDDDLTYTNEELKLITKGGYYFNIKANKSGTSYVTKYNNKDVSAFIVMFALAKHEGIDPIALFKKLKSHTICEIYAKPGKLEDEVVLDTDSLLCDNSGETFLKLFADSNSLARVRDKMNKILSLDRALGKRVYRKIELSDGTCIPAETIITKAVLDRIKKDRINEIEVECVPNKQGNYLYEPVVLRVLRKGTEWIPCLHSVLPDYKGQYLDKDLRLGPSSGVVIPEFTVVTRPLLDMFAYNGVTHIYITEKIGSDNFTELPFYNTIVGNRHFRECDIGISNSEKYVYIGESGEIEPPKDYITAYDYAAMISLFDRLCLGQDYEVIASRDLGLRKKVAIAGDLFHEALVAVASEFIYESRSKLLKVFNLDDTTAGYDKLNSPDEMENIFFKLSNKWWTHLYTNMKVLQVVDKTNPVAYYSSLTKVNTIVANANQITGSMRTMSMGHYGRLCPFEIPSGKKLGTVNNLAVECKIKNGKMYEPYYVVKHIGKKSFLSDEVLELTTEEEEKFRIADITSLKLNENREICNTERVLARVPNVHSLEKVNISHISADMIDLVNVNPQQSLSIASTTIPNIGSDDSVRVTFEISMVKQAKCLVNGEAPIVLTSAFTDIPRISPYFMVVAEDDGEVLEVQDNMLVVRYDNIESTESGRIRDHIAVYTIKLKEFSSTSIIIRSIDVKEGQRVQKGDVLVSSNYTKDGLMVIGCNALVGYIPEGYNYEDGVFESGALKHKMTSYGANKESIKIPGKCYEVTSIQEVNKFRYIRKDSRVYSLKHMKGSKKFKEIVRSVKLKGFVVDVVKEYDSYSKQVTGATAYTVSFDYVNQGDKFANRHGNKGVTPKVHPNTSMPYFENGVFLDLVYNPMGVPGRMNIGQLLENNEGFAGYILGTRIQTDSYDGSSVGEIRQLLSYAWHLANDNNADAVNAAFPDLPKEFKEKCLTNLPWIRSWKGCFNKDGTAFMYNPNTGKLYEEPVVVGINYLYKLVQEGAKKVHGRGGYITEPYVEKTGSPTKGSSNFGGQRQGEMEFAALLAYGASGLIHEYQNERGDNSVARNNATVRAVHSGNNYLVDEGLGIRRSVQEFLNTAQGLGFKLEFTEGEIPEDTREVNERRVVWSAKTLSLAENVESKEEDRADSFRAYAEAMLE